MSAPRLFETVLIANRGEIACRIIDSCRRLGIVCVAVYSEADVNARHVRLADRALCIGPAPARDSYLRIDRIIEAALRCGAQAVHPGYGFLSENPQFAEQCARAGLVFIGPPVAAMRAMSSKAAAKQLMERSGVPVLPGYHGEEQGAARLRDEARLIGFPVLIKACSGGGGKGMRIVEETAQFDDALGACQREARSSFGDEQVLIEKYLPRPRHVEVQVFGDSQGQLVHLDARDCSAQRRHQKLVEEAPAPGLADTQRAALCDAALAAAAAVHYVGAGTVEFLLEPSGAFYFLEMNTRIQVEHPVTEMITGVDLVAWQLQIAAGGPLPLEQAQIVSSGHAIEVRLYAETPEAGFLPATGRLQRFDLPAARRSLRLETGVTAGDIVGIDYDPLLAKLIVHAATRDSAVEAMAAALAQVHIAGINNNLQFLRRLIDCASFRRGSIDTGFVERERERLAPGASPPDALALAAAALWTLRAEQHGSGQTSPWGRQDGWRLNAVLRRRLQFEAAAGPPGAPEASPRTVLIDYEADARQLWIDGLRLPGSLRDEDSGEFRLLLGDQSVRVRIELEAGALLRIAIGGAYYRLRRLEAPPPAAAAPGGAVAPGAATALCAPMPGRILEHVVAIGAPLERGAPLLIMEAMKMEHVLHAPVSGTVRAFLAAVGEQVMEGARLVEFERQA